MKAFFMDRLKDDVEVIRQAVQQMEMSFGQFRKGSEDTWPALDDLKALLARFEKTGDFLMAITVDRNSPATFCYAVFGGPQ